MTSSLISRVPMASFFAAELGLFCRAKSMIAESVS